MPWSSVVRDAQRSFDLHGTIPAGLSRAQYQEVRRFALAEGSDAFQDDLFIVYPRREAVRHAQGHPHLPSAWLALGNALQNTGRHTEGVDMWQRAYRSHQQHRALEHVREAWQDEDADVHERAYAALHIDALSPPASACSGQAPSQQILRRCKELPELDARLRAWADGDTTPLLGPDTAPSPLLSLATLPRRDAISGHWLGPLPKPHWRAIEVDGWRHCIDTVALARDPTGDVLLAILGESATWAPLPQDDVASVQLAPSSLRAIAHFLSTGTLPAGLRPFEQHLLQLDGEFLGLQTMLIELNRFAPLRRQLAHSAQRATRARALLSLGNRYVEHGCSAEGFVCWQQGMAEQSSTRRDDAHASHHASASDVTWHRYHKATLNLFQDVGMKVAVRSLGAPSPSDAEPAAVIRLRAYLAGLQEEPQSALALFAQAAAADHDNTVNPSWGVGDWFAHSAQRYAEEPATLLAWLKWLEPTAIDQEKLREWQKAMFRLPNSAYIKGAGDDPRWSTDLHIDQVYVEQILRGHPAIPRAIYHAVLERHLVDQQWTVLDALTRAWETRHGSDPLSGAMRALVRARQGATRPAPALRPPRDGKKRKWQRPLVHYAHAVVLHLAGQAKEAEAKLSIATKSHYTSPILAGLCAQQWAAMGQAPQAIKNLQCWQGPHKSRRPVVLALIALLRQEHRPAEAVEEAARLHMLPQQNDAEDARLRFDLLLEDGRPDEALVLFERHWQRSADSRIWLALAASYRRLQRPCPPSLDLATAGRRFAGDAEVLLEQARHFCAAADGEAARACVAQAQLAGASDACCRRVEWQIVIAEGDKQSAVAHGKAFVRAYPHDEEGMALLDEALRADHQPGAIGAFLRALPQPTPASQAFLATWYARDGRHQQALAVWRAMGPLEALPSAVALAMACSLAAIKDHTQALTSARHAVATRPVAKGAAVLLATLLQEQGEQDQALSWAKHAMEQFVESSSWLNYGQWLKAAKFHEQARYALERGLERHPDSLDLRLALSAWHKSEAGGRDEAEQQARLALTQHPQSHKAMQALIELLVDKSPLSAEAWRLARQTMNKSAHDAAFCWCVARMMQARQSRLGLLIWAKKTLQALPGHQKAHAALIDSRSAPPRAPLHATRTAVQWVTTLIHDEICENGAQAPNVQHKLLRLSMQQCLDVGTTLKDRDQIPSHNAWMREVGKRPDNTVVFAERWLSFRLEKNISVVPEDFLPVQLAAVDVRSEDESMSALRLIRLSGHSRQYRRLAVDILHAHPKRPHIILEMGHHFDACGRPAAAQAMFRSALFADPRNDAALQASLSCAYQMGDAQAAARLALRCVEHPSIDAPPSAAIVWALREAGQPKEALRWADALWPTNRQSTAAQQFGQELCATLLAPGL